MTTALGSPRQGIFAGQSALINLAGQEASKLVLRAPVALVRIGDRAYLVAELWKGPDDQAELAQLLALSKRTGLPLVAAGGQVVFHLHMHVMPRHDGIAMLPPASRKEDGKVLEENAAKLIAALKAG